MELWIGDYLKLRNEIHYLNFKTTDTNLSGQEIEETQFQLDERLQREGEFKIIINSFEDLENQILRMKYIGGMTLEMIAKELKYTAQYIYHKHAQIMIIISKFEKIYTELELFKKNFPRKKFEK